MFKIMASLIPNLSEKAMIQIAHIETFDGDPRTDPYDPFSNFKAFQKLFDLEEYPITVGQIIDYLEGKGYKKSYDYSKQGEIYFNLPSLDNCVYPYSFDRLYSLELIAKDLGVRDIDIIAEIHGWW